ncbi:hypothetical protein [Aeromonas popoffii]|uniref:hypothetical protein n=1 Tax=Aeromonas popoffii TaxID=70856 RepID=UPI0030CBF80E
MIPSPGQAHKAAAIRFRPVGHYLAALACLPTALLNMQPLDGAGSGETLRL